jgi:hypothetical protein
MGWLFWGSILPACVAGIALGVRRPLRRALEDLRLERAREQFRQQREWLEARFVGSLARIDPAEHQRWEDAHWQDEIVWARERTSRQLLALTGVAFEPDLIFDLEDTPRHATALFEFRKGRWHAEGKSLDSIRPDEAFLRHQRFEPVAPQRRG